MCLIPLADSATLQRADSYHRRKTFTVDTPHWHLLPVFVRRARWVHQCEHGPDLALPKLLLPPLNSILPVNCCWRELTAAPTALDFSTA